MPEFEVTLHPDLRFWLEPAGTHMVVPEGAGELAGRINEALEALREDGTLSEISATFFGGDDVSELPDVEDEGFIVIDLDELPQ
jgi:cystine transport system substrate-binding protein